MRRREILTLLAGAAAGVPGDLAAQPQPAGAGRLPVVGLLAIGRTDRQPSPSTRIVPSALAALGWTEGHNFRLVVREGNGHLESVTPLIEELLQMQADVIVASGATVVSRLAPATRTVPIIMAASSIDPVRAGWAASYASPGGNVTGLTLANDEIVPKQVQLLKDAIPAIRHVGFVKTRSNPVTQEIADIGQKTAAAMEMKASLGLVEEAQDVEPEIDRLRSEGVDALLVVADPIIDNFRERIAEAAIARDLPTAGQISFYADAGFLLTYAPVLSAIHRRAAIFADRILRGAKAADLPIERPSKFVFALNLKTAKRIGLIVSPTLLSLADEVIE
ncbi:MAG TPA: ABC transporter substrate-binding protein [Beijerinckiaceae bacterium]|nr:ABC transporter substrate-binding protein [Beijerinckiaceae bacterium]